MAAHDLDLDLDIEIRGAGPVGCTLALALRGAGFRVALAGRRPAEIPAGQAGRAFRPLALSQASRLILERVGAWDGLTSTPIEQIHVSQAGRFGRTRISRDDVGLPALGYVVDYAALAAHLATAAGPSDPAPAQRRARLVVHAEGLADGLASSKDYGHSAIVALVECAPAAGTVAWERFTPDGGEIRSYLDLVGAKSVKVPYRANRAVIFDSALFHETDTFRFRDEYENRRVSVTLVYGAPAA